MSQTESQDLFGDAHVRRYRETGGEVGHIWKNGSTILLLTTIGRKSGEPRTHALIYGTDDSGTLALVASKGGAPEHPAWYLNLVDQPTVEIELLDEKFSAEARTADETERAYWWPIMTAQWPDYDSYQASTDRQIPVVLIERAD
ncbi:MAG TPA: nitroreductase family deazaflavin-dependent oxidoreductase [Baekduia sp.]|nr:nitroreductase family deazaflavin-dependent oxidoreductase [Baekduia sp.]